MYITLVMGCHVETSNGKPYDSELIKYWLNEWEIVLLCRTGEIRLEIRVERNCYLEAVYAQKAQTFSIKIVRSNIFISKTITHKWQAFDIDERVL